jgi:deazaflavin-dependent oxidoreductase (nitroreductase family)
MPIMTKLPDWIQNHIDQYRSDPEKGHMWDSTVVGGPGPLPCLLLTTVGRKSGKKRVLPLLYAAADDGYVIVASKGGAPSHPAWYLNLQANPEVEVQVAAKIFSAKAETVSEADRDRYWDIMREIWPPYDDYQSKTERKIPIVFLTPIT